MRIFVTVEAVLKFKVDLPRTEVAPAAFLNRLHDRRRMADMAASTRNCSVPASGSFYVIHRTAMTLDTVFFFRSLDRQSAGINRKYRYPCDQE